MGFKGSMIEGAVRGVVAWLSYGVIEFILAYALPRGWTPGLQIPQWQWPALALLFGAYAVAGLLLGGAGGAILAAAGNKDRTRFQIVALLTLTVAFAANLIPAWPLARSEQIALGVSALLALTFSAALVSDKWQNRTGFLHSGLVVSLLLLASPWMSREVLHESSSAIKAGVSLLALAGISAAAAASHRFIGRTRVAPGRVFAAVLGGAAIWFFAQTSGLSGAVRAEVSRGGATQKRPNVLLITMDTVRADHLSVYGYRHDTTPRLAEFARGATVYTRAIAAGDFTLPSHASIFTGVYPGWHGAYPSHPDYPAERPLHPGAVTLAKVLAKNGFWTGGIFANSAFLQPDTGLNQGFELWETGRPPLLSNEERPFYLREGARRLLDFWIDTDEFDAMFLRASDVNRRAFAVLDQLRNHGPFLLFLNYMDAHFPYVPPAPFDGELHKERNHTPLVAGYNELKNAVNAGRRHITRQEQDALVARYDSGIAYIDSEIGKLLEKLKRSGLYDETLIVITADHGEAFGDHDTIGHTVTSVFQEGAHIPLLVKYPGQRQGQRSDALVSHVDLMPSILDAVGCPLPSGLQGRLLRSPRDASDVVFSEAYTMGEHDRNTRLRGVRRGIFTTSAKLIAWDAGPPEFYNLTLDPGEAINRYRGDDPEAAALLNRLNSWVKGIPRQLPTSKKVDKSTIDRIRSLGYVQ